MIRVLGWPRGLATSSQGRIVFKLIVVGTDGSDTATQAVRQASGKPGGMPPEFVDMIWKYLDRGTKRAILRRYRHADPDRLLAAGENLGKLDCPALVVWGAKDPYTPGEWGEAFAKALSHADADIRHDAGHWPWIDDPSIIDRVLNFVS